MYVDANGNQFESYDDACYYYGADTPAQIEAEQKAIALEEHEEWCIEHGLWMDMKEYVHPVVEIVDEIPF